MAVARDERIRKHASDMPPSWMTLYELTKLDDAVNAFVADRSEAGRSSPPGRHDPGCAMSGPHPPRHAQSSATLHALAGLKNRRGRPVYQGSDPCAAYVKLKVASTGRNRPLAHPNPAIQPMFESSPHAGNLLCHTVFPSQCQPIVGSLKQTFYCFILAGQRKPRDGHREMKFAAMRLGCFLSRQ
jgi:hypothetical protein